MASFTALGWAGGPPPARVLVRHLVAVGARDAQLERDIAVSDYGAGSLAAQVALASTRRQHHRAHNRLENEYSAGTQQNANCDTESDEDDGGADSHAGMA